MNRRLPAPEIMDRTGRRRGPPEPALVDIAEAIGRKLARDDYAARQGAIPATLDQNRPQK